MKMNALLVSTQEGLYCPAGGFYVDPWRGVDRAVITHAHSDHARPGCGSYLCADRGRGLLQHRLGSGAAIEGVAWHQEVLIGDVRVKLVPAGHVLGSSQVVITHGSRRAVFTGDFKTTAEGSCDAWEPVKADLWVGECTFGLPIYRWPDQATVIEEIRQWWRQNEQAGCNSVLSVYSLGKAQRILHALRDQPGSIVLHGAVAPLTELYRREGVAMPETILLQPRQKPPGGSLILAPPAALGSAWARRTTPHRRGAASGWMQVRGRRRHLALDRGFVLSDHADFDGLLAAVEASEAGQIGVTHGYTEAFGRFLGEQGREVTIFPTRYTGEAGADEAQGISVEDSGAAAGETGVVGEPGQ